MRILECAGKNYRITRQRQAVLDVLNQTDSQPDPNWVFDQVRKSMPNISLGTVNRTLSLLRQAGLVSYARSATSTNHMDSPTNLRCHATCIRCGHMLDVKVGINTDLEKETASATGFVITGHRLDFFGLCPACASKERRS